MQNSQNRKNFISGFVFLSFLLICIPLLFQSCELEPNPAGNTVEVQILNYDGFKLYYNGVYTSLGKYPYSIPDMNGICKFENVQIPYNLNIGLYSNPNYNGLSYHYAGLHRNNPVLLIIYNENGSPSREIEVRVKFPPISDNKIGMVRFISKDIIDSVEGGLGFYFPMQGIARSHDTTRYLYYRIPGEMNSVSGKLIFIEGTGSWNYQNLIMQSYDHYGSKDVTLREGFMNRVTFTENEIQTNPQELPVSIDVSYPQEVNSTIIKFFLNFEGYGKGSLFLLSQLNNQSGHLEAVIPLLTDINNNIKIFSSHNYSSWGNKLFPFKSIEIEPGGHGNISHSVPEVLKPQQTEIIDENDSLTVNDNGEKGIYVFSLSGFAPMAFACIVSEINTIRFGDFKYADFIYKPNTMYELSVAKFTTFNSIDEFTEKPYFLNSNFNSVSISRPRFFGTAP